MTDDWSIVAQLRQVMNCSEIVAKGEYVPLLKTWRRMETVKSFGHQKVRMSQFCSLLLNKIQQKT